jgi:hypothetical protein
MAKKIKMRLLFILTFLSILNITSFAQQNKDIDPVWEKYYKENPARVYEHYTGSDFITVIDSVEFVPAKNGVFNGRVNLLKRMLLTASHDGLEILSSEGWYYSRTYKHDDFYFLYNMTYKKITKKMWDVFCPYLIPLMNLDGTINLE